MGGCASKEVKIKTEENKRIPASELFDSKTPSGINNNSNLTNQQRPIKEEFIKEAIEAHNKYRQLHGAAKLQHDPQLSLYSQIYAEKLAELDNLKHSDCLMGDKQIGENIAMQNGAMLSAKQATDLWYNEIQDYNFDNPGFNMSTGHFTQVVWKDTEYMGIGYAKSNNGTFYVVANYYPPGNVMGYFDQNVYPK
jgi:uncharacterized protein YkwD